LGDSREVGVGVFDPGEPAKPLKDCFIAMDGIKRVVAELSFEFIKDGFAIL